jgi:hypothetical protein
VTFEFARIWTTPLAESALTLIVTVETPASKDAMDAESAEKGAFQRPGVASERSGM